MEKLLSFRRKLKQLKMNFKKLLIIILSIISINIKAQTLKVDITYYYPKYSNITADGSKINHKHLKAKQIQWCAVSRDIWDMFPKNSYDKQLYIEEFGYYHVKDKMHKRWRHKVDILIHHTHLSQVVNKKNIKVTLHYKIKKWKFTKQL